MARKIKMYDGTQWVELIDTINNQTITGTKTFSNNTYYNSICYHMDDVNIDYGSVIFFGNASDYQRIYSTGFGGKLTFQAGGYEAALDNAGKFYCKAVGQDISSPSGAHWEQNDRITTIEGSQICLHVKNDNYAYATYYEEKLNLLVSYSEIILEPDSSYDADATLTIRGAYGQHSGRYSYTTILINDHPAVTGYIYNVHMKNTTSTGSHFNLTFTLKSRGTMSSANFNSLAYALYDAGYNSSSRMLSASGTIAGNIVHGIYATRSGSSYPYTYTLTIVYSTNTYEDIYYSMTSQQGTIEFFANGQFFANS